MTVVTGAPKDVGLQLDPSRVVFASPVLRESTDNNSIITTKTVTAYPDPITGIVSAEVDPGVCVITYKGHTYTVTIPATEGIDLWNLIAAAIPPLPTTPDVVIAAAVEAYLEENPPAGGGGGGGPVDIDDVVGLTAVLNAKADEPVTVGDVTGLATALTGKQDTPVTTSDVTGLTTTLAAKQDTSGKGQANGYAGLDSSSLIPAVNLPSYVDDVLEYANVAAMPATGVTGKIYVALDSNKTYRWSGTAYVEISSSPGSTDAVTEGASNLYYTPTRADTRADLRIAAATGVSVQPYDASTTSYTSAEKTKLSGVASGATANASDAALRARASHTGTQQASTTLAASGTPSASTYLRGDDTWATPAGGGGSGDVTLTGVQTLTQKTVGDDLKFTTTATPTTPAAGTSKLYNRTGVSGIDAMAYLTSIGVPIVLGRDVCFYAKNTSGSTIAKGSVVYASSATGTTLFISKAQADATMSKLPALGIVTADVLNNTYGMVLQSGLIQTVDTSGMTDGATIYCSATTAGVFTSTAPTHPAVKQAVGIVVNANISGSILVTCCNAINMARLDGVNGNSFAVGDGTGVAAKTVLFKNSNTGTLTWTPTGSRTITLPDATGTVYLSGGTDVPITDGGTGVSTLPTGLLVGAGTGAITAATAPTGTIVGTTDTQTLSGKTLTNPTITNYTESVVAIGNTSTAKTIALTSGTVQTATLTGNCTFTMPTATAGKSFVLYLYTGAGSFTATFTGVKWSGSVAPTITTTAARMDILNFVADGASWYGTFSQNYVP